ncbi:hypothetical protein G8764_22065 [Pseudomaricurvus alcaniphilus]|uniref:hypothetical protein n=1 Tax=Pseudomaricurvus alcaniphilus TaxID=1166482 RepID=UPI0014099CB7|nr:hypothetical protein [Pseudomaricurvus alcaniphilus]NHN39992.1 hypothetical protein [Pseudomaricurvus alcaniphilus]
MSKHFSDSSEQQKAEAFILKALERELGLKFDPSASLSIDIGVKPDAIDPQQRVVVEVYARIGEVKGAQLHKIKGDILKLALIDKRLGEGWRKIICFASEEAAKYVKGNSWVAEAARVFDVEVHVVRLPENYESVVVSAQTRQKMVNPT